MGRHGYPPEFRRKVLYLLKPAGKSPTWPRGLQLSQETIYAWRRQDRIDRGLRSGLTTGEKAELAAAKKRIATLEAELAATRWAMELVRGVVPPKTHTRQSGRWALRDSGPAAANRACTGRGRCGWQAAAPATSGWAAASMSAT
jgi:hypothetical protein